MRAVRTFIVATLVFPLSIGLADSADLLAWFHDAALEGTVEPVEKSVPLIPSITFGCCSSFNDAIVSSRPDDRVSKLDRPSNFLGWSFGLRHFGALANEIRNTAQPASIDSYALAFLDVVRLRF